MRSSVNRREGATEVLLSRRGRAPKRSVDMSKEAPVSTMFGEPADMSECGTKGQLHGYETQRIGRLPPQAPARCETRGTRGGSSRRGRFAYDGLGSARICP